MPERLRRPARALLIAAAIAVPLTACPTTGVFDSAQYAIVTITQTEENGDFEVDAGAIVFRAEQAPLPDSRSPASSCAVQPGAVPPAPTPGFIRISAGDTIVVRTAGVPMRLLAVADPQRMRYVRDDDPPLVAPAGAQLEVVIPGASGGFPAFTGTITVLGDPGFADVELPEEGEPLTVTWAQAGSGATRIMVRLLYTPPGAAAEQIVCDGPDTGTLTVPAGMLGGWRAAPAASRSGTGRRWRSEITQRGESILALYVQYEQLLQIEP